jgi:hypothetical protein
VRASFLARFIELSQRHAGYRSVIRQIANLRYGEVVGRITLKVVPFPGSLSTSIRP